VGLADGLLDLRVVGVVGTAIVGLVEVRTVGVLTAFNERGEADGILEALTVGELVEGDLPQLPFPFPFPLPWLQLGDEVDVTDGGTVSRNGLPEGNRLKTVEEDGLAVRMDVGAEDGNVVVDGAIEGFTLGDQLDKEVGLGTDDDIILLIVQP